MSARRFLSTERLRITRAAMCLAIAEVGFTLVWMLLPGDEMREDVARVITAAPSGVFAHARVWTLLTTGLLNPQLLGTILHVVVLWQVGSTLERFWSTGRFLRFAAITQLAGTLAGTLLGYFVTHDDAPVVGLNPFIMGLIVAYGVVYARQPVDFFGRLPLTARQLMYVLLAFNALLVVLGGLWNDAASLAAACGTAALMTSKWSPMLAWKRRKIAKARAKLSVLQGGKVAPPAKPKPRDDHRFLN